MTMFKKILELYNFTEIPYLVSGMNLKINCTYKERFFFQKNRQYIFQIDKSLVKLTGYQVKMKIFLSISEIVTLKVKLVNYFLVCNDNFSYFF
jgi:hypothetical protein